MALPKPKETGITPDPNVARAAISRPNAIAYLARWQNLFLDEDYSAAVNTEDFARSPFTDRIIPG